MRREARSAPLAVSFGDLRRGSSPLRRRGDSVSEESGDAPPRAVKQPRERRPSPPRHRAGVMVLPRGALSPPLSFPPRGGRVRVRVGVGRLPRGSVRLEHPPVSLHSYDAHERRPREFVRYGFPYVRERFPHAVFDSIAHFSRWHVAFAHASHEFERDSPERDSSLRRERHVERFDEVHGEHPRRPRADAQRRGHPSEESFQVRPLHGSAPVVELVKRAHVPRERVRAEFPLLVILRVFEILDDHRGEEVEHDHRHEDDEGDEERIRRVRPAVPLRPAPRRKIRTVAHQPDPLVVRGDPKQRQHRHRERFEIGVFVERVAAANGPERQHPDVRVDEKEQKDQRADVPKRGEGSDERG